MKLTISPQNKIAVLISVLVITSLLVLLSTQAIADMFGIFKKYDVHLCPEVNGRIIFQGNPVSNIEVFRSLTYGDDDEILDKALTDAGGFFSFEEKNIRSRKPGSMFDESRIRQVILVNYQDKDYMLWYTQAIGIEPNRALTEKLNKLYCDLANTEEEIEFKSYEYPQDGYLVHSICRWSV